LELRKIRFVWEESQFDEMQRQVNGIQLHKDKVDKWEGKGNET